MYWPSLCHVPMPTESLVPPCGADGFSWTLVGFVVNMFPSLENVNRCGWYGAPMACTSHEPTMSLCPPAPAGPVTVTIPPTSTKAKIPAIIRRSFTGLLPESNLERRSGVIEPQGRKRVEVPLAGVGTSTMDSVWLTLTREKCVIEATVAIGVDIQKYVEIASVVIRERRDSVVKWGGQVVTDPNPVLANRNHHLGAVPAEPGEHTTDAAGTSPTNSSLSRGGRNHCHDSREQQAREYSQDATLHFLIPS